MTPSTIGSSVSISGADGTAPRKAHEKSTEKKGSIACGRAQLSGQGERGGEASRLHCVCEGHGHQVEAQVGQDVAQRVYRRQRHDGQQHVPVNLLAASAERRPSQRTQPRAPWAPL